MTELAMKPNRFVEVLTNAMDENKDYRLVLDPLAVLELYTLLKLCTHREWSESKPDNCPPNVKDILKQLQSFMRDIGLSEEDIAFLSATNVQ